MMSLNALPSAASVYGAYASISSSVMLLKTTYHQIVPSKVQDYVFSAISNFFKKRAVVEENSMFTLIVEKYDDYHSYESNHLFDAFDIYMSNKATPITNCLKISKLSQKTSQLTTRLAQEETVTDLYKGVAITWSYICKNQEDGRDKISWFELRFEKTYKDIVINSYIPFVMNEVATIQNAKRELKLHSYEDKCWSSTDLEHSSTFETLAMEPSEKKALMDDLDLFVKRRDFFKRVGRAWKRGYLLYGPPGTGKSSLVAAMANYLNFDIYDLQLMNVSSDSGLRNLLMGIANRSILVIEDIDCSVDLPDRTTQEENGKSNSGKFSLSGLLNCIDGLWSSCGDERIIIFTTNYKDKLDPALLRPGRMDMHIHMSYLTINGFKTLASTYLEITDHWRFGEIEDLLGSIEVTPAEVAEELMRASDADVCLGRLVSFLKEKKRKRTSIESEDGEETTPESKNGKDSTPGVELIPKAKKIKTNASQDGLYGRGPPTPSDIVAPVNYIGMQDEPYSNVEVDGKETNPKDDKNIEDDCGAQNTSSEMDDEDSERDEEDSQTDDEDS